MKQQYIYKCNVTGYYIEFIVDNDEKNALLNTIITDYCHLKPLMALIRTSVDKLKNMNIKKIKQTVNYNDWNNFLKNKTTWNIIKDDKLYEIKEIECDVEDFLTNYGIGIGILK